MSKFAPIAPLLDTDFYKVDHRRQYPEGTTAVMSNWTDRGSRIPGIDHTVHFGLQGFIISWVEDAWAPFFKADEDVVADLYEEFLASTLGDNQVGSDHVRELHRLGHLPLRFRSLPEGSLVPIKVPKFTVENTRPEFFWVTNFIETALSSYVWHPATSATLAVQTRKLLNEYAIKTVGTTEGVAFQAHDFSFRGQSGSEAAAASSAGHLLSFTGSDTMSAGLWIDHNYPGDNGLVLSSVPATEHSVATSFGVDGDVEYFSHLLDVYPSGIISAVSDSYNLWDTLNVTLPELKDRILARDGKLVIRPDSGDPVDILCGTGSNPKLVHTADVKTPLEDPGYFGVIELLWETFGGTVNEQGYKVLDSHIGAIYGDSITYERAEQILSRLEAKGFASTNVILGFGSYFYNGMITRDTFGSAMKATWVEIDGVGTEIFKDPITDDGTKKSAKGRLSVVVEDGDYKLIDGKRGADIEGSVLDELRVVWEDGKFTFGPVSFDNVRTILAAEVAK